MSILRRLAATTPARLDLGLLLLRLWFGLVLAFGHGLSKMTALDSFTRTVAAQGFPMPGLMGFGAAASELLGGLLLALGLFTRLAALPVAVTMTMAALIVHRADPFMKKEFALCYAVAAVVLLVAGPGKYSLDARLFGSGSSADGEADGASKADSRRASL
jgi:putative oxidoreductase